MKAFYYLKIKLYNFFNTSIGKSLLTLLSKFVYVKNLGKTKKAENKKNKKFLIAITIDTESGYLNINNERVWQKSKPDAYIGFYKGIENWRKLLNKYNVKSTFFISTNCFNAEGNNLTKITKQISLLDKENHEIGLHLHPDSDLALQNKLKRKFDYTSARFYKFNQIKSFLTAGKNLIAENIAKELSKKIISFRWGNWALDTNAVKALQETGFKIDSSAVPGIKGHINDGMYYDWSRADEHYPWHLSLKDYQNTKDQNSKVLEIPIATFNFLGLTLRADPVYTVLLKAAFDYYYKNADRSKKPFVFVVMSHSIEGTRNDGTITRVIDDMEEFIRYSKKLYDVEFVTLKEACNKLNTN